MTNSEARKRKEERQADPVTMRCPKKAVRPYGSPGRCLKDAGHDGRCVA